MKHKLLITGLATATLLSTAALTHYSTNVYAEGAAVTKQDIADYFTELEKQAEVDINKNDKITDKEAAILEAKAAIGKEDLLKAIDGNQITPEEVLKDIEEANKTGETETGKTEDGEEYKPQTVPGATAAPGAELVRNDAGEVTEVKPINGGIDADAQDKINKRLDEENTDVKDAEERLAAAKQDEKEAENNREEAKENVKAAQEELAAAKEVKAKYEKELESYKDAEGEQADQYREAARADIEKAEATLKQAEEAVKEAKAALEQADEDYYSYVADREAEEVRVLRRQIAKDKADGKDTTALEEELDIALNGVKPAENEVKPYEGPVTGFFDETGENPIAEGELGTLAPRNIPGYTYTGTSYTKDGILRHTYKATGFNGVPADNSNPGHQGDGEPRQGNRPTSGATTPAQTPAATPAAEVPATTAEATSEEAAPTAVAAQAEESKKEELPNTGTAELGLITPAVLSFLAGLGLTFGKKEDK